MSQTMDPSGSQPLPAASNNALPPGTVVGDYTIQGLVGEGGFGVVYRAFDNVMQREIALKEYMPNALARRRPDGQVELRAPQYEATFHAGRRSFVNEARLLAQFDHKALVKVYRFLEANGTAYMVMPLYQGRTLKQILREGAAVDEAWLKQLIAPLLDALETLHGARCFHRDVAPDNILILDSGGPLLLDFGAARRIIGDMTQAVTVVIKPGYAPVEQYADDNSLQQGPWTDIYALAAVIRLAITGKPPATSVTRMVSDPVKPLAEIATGYSPQFLRAVDFGLAVRPEDRPQSIAEFREALGLSMAPARPAPPPASGPAEPKAAPAAAATPVTPPAPPSAAAPVSPAPPIAPAAAPQRAEAAPIVPALKPVPPPLKPDATGPIGETVPMRQHRTMPPAPSPSPAEAARAPAAHPSIPVKPPPMAPSQPVVARPAPAPMATPRRQWMPIAIVVAMMVIVVGAGYFVMQAVTAPPPRETAARSPASTGAVVTQAPPVSAPAPEPKAVPPAISPAAPAPVQPAPAPVQAAPTQPPPTQAPAAPSPVTAAPAPAPAAPAAASPPASVAAATPPPASPAPPTGRVMLDIKPWGEVVVDGKPRGLSPPLKVLQLPEGAHRVEVRNPAGAALIRDVKVTAGGRIDISHTFK